MSGPVSGRRTLLACVAVVVVVASAGAFAAGQGDAMRRVIAGVSKTDPLLVGLGLVVSALAVMNRGLLNQASHRAVGLDAGFESITRASAVGFSAQKLVKSAGIIGLTVFVRHGRRCGYAPAKVVAACILSAAAAFAALGALLAATIGVLVVSGRLDGWWIAAAVGFGLYGAVIAAAALVIVKSRRLANVLWHRAQRLRLWAARRFRRGDVPASNDLPAELFDAIGEARRRPRVVRRLLAHGIAGKLLGATMLGLALAAVGAPMSPSAVLVVYAGALAASMVSIVPWGLGAVEGSTAALLVASGVSPGTAALAVALFRLFDLWVPVAVGALASRGELRSVRSSMPGTMSPRPQGLPESAGLVPAPVAILPPVAARPAAA